jgi:hypothetical protein
LESIDCAVDEKIVLRLPDVVKEIARTVIVEPIVKSSFKENEYTKYCILSSLSKKIKINKINKNKKKKKK